MSKSSTVTAKDLMAQAEVMQRTAEALKKKELPGVIERIKSAIDFYGLTAGDLGFGSAVKGAKVSAVGNRDGRKKQAKVKSAPRSAYSDGAGNTWSGRGPKPGWMKAAIENGATKESFLIEQQS